jgi:hypothetical protein
MSEKLGKVTDQVAKTKPPSQCEAIRLASKLVTNYAVFPSKQSRKRTQQLITAGKPRDEHERLTLTPLTEFRRIMGQMSNSGPATCRGETVTAFP